MNWSEFKRLVESKLSGLEVTEEEVHIEWIDISHPDKDSVGIRILGGSDGRVSMEVFDE